MTKNLFYFFLLIPFFSISQGWVQTGQTINGTAFMEGLGRGISSNEQGDIIAVGSVGDDTGGTNAGLVKVLQLVNNVWTQLGQNIIGEASGDNLGESVSLNDQGNILAVGARLNDNFANNSGQVRIFEYIGSSWVQIGSSIYGENASDTFGQVVELSDDGTTVAISAPGNSSNESAGGQIRIYHYNGTDWVQLGQSIYGSSYEYLGSSLAISGNGNILAVGSESAYEGGGYANIYSFDGSQWILLGQPFFYEEEYESYGHAITLNQTGDTVAISAINAENGNLTSAGKIKVFKYSSGSWSQLGQTLYGSGAFFYFGRSLSLSNDGNTLAIGADNTFSDDYAGSVSVYEYNGFGSWNQLGQTEDGDSIGESFGYSVKLNGDGSRFVTSAPSDSSIAEESGQVKTYFYDENLGFSNISQNNDVSIYPNPSNGLVNISSKKQIITVELFNTYGQTVMVTNDSILDISNMNTEVYIVKVTFDDKSSVTNKLIKK